MTIARKLDPTTGAIVEFSLPERVKSKPRRCKGCDRATRLCGVLVDAYCADCRQLPLPFRQAAELEAQRAKLEAQRAERRPKLPPRMCDLGWSCKGELWTHRSGASVEFRGSFVMGNRGARINGGPWEPIREFFWVTIDRALRDFGG